jgi:type I restriction enzyme S subunit
MARALFKSWFVDFDPVRAKAEGRDTGLPKPLADLFPDCLVDSELGDIPEGWKVAPLADLTAVITKGTTPTQEDIEAAPGDGPPVNYVRVNAINANGEILIDKLTKIPESLHLGVLKRSVLCAKDVLYTIAGTIGRVSIVEESLLPANTNQAVAIIRPKPKLPPAFLALTLRQAAFREELHSNIVHAVQANLSLGMLSKARVAVPREDTLPQLFAPIDFLVEGTSSARAQSHTLAVLRDALLPKLISGELRVQDADRIVSDVT